MTIALEDFTRTIYGQQHLDHNVLQRLRAVLGKDSLESSADMRAVAMALDRTVHPTPMVIRFSQDDIRFAMVNGIECPIDRHDQSISIPIEKDGWFEPHVVACLKKVCLPGSITIDIGANIGCHTLTMATLVGPNGRCYAFEPNSENCQMILIGIERNKLKNVTLIPVALSNQPGWAYFSTHIGSNGGIVSEDFVALRGNGGIVPLFALDGFDIKRADVIKIDVEGGEYKALKGREALLTRSRPAILSEFSAEMTEGVSGVKPEEYLGCISHMNYQLFLLDKVSRTPVSIESISALLAGWGSIYRIEDLLFLPREKSHQIGST